MRVEDARTVAEQWIADHKRENVTYEASPTAAKMANAAAIILDLCSQIEQMQQARKAVTH